MDFGVLEHEVRRGCFEILAREIQRLLVHDLGGLEYRVARHDCRTARIRADAEAHESGVAVDHCNILERNTENVAADLCKRRLLALSLGSSTGINADLSAG